MSKSFSFKLNCGQYVLHADNTPVSRVLDEVAICLDKASGTRHKFGDPEVVRAWHAKTQASFREVNQHEMADDLVVIQGRFTLEDLNKVIDISDYAYRLYEKVMAGTAAMLDLDGNIVRPALPAA